LLQKEVSVQKVDNAGKKLFRVVAASFPSRDEAEKYREEIQQKHHLQAVVL
jgi:cell division protein FtsN